MPSVSSASSASSAMSAFASSSTLASVSASTSISASASTKRKPIVIDPFAWFGAEFPDEPTFEQIRAFGNQELKGKKQALWNYIDHYFHLKVIYLYCPVLTEYLVEEDEMETATFRAYATEEKKIYLISGPTRKLELYVREKVSEYDWRYFEHPYTEDGKETNFTTLYVHIHGGDVDKGRRLRDGHLCYPLLVLSSKS
jgi:hypothetical protein